MVLNSVVENALNQQINAELYASYLYLSMSAWLEHAGLPGFARFMRGQSQEEYGNAMRFLEHIEDRNGFVGLLPIKAPPTEFDSVEDVIAQALAHETHVSVNQRHVPHRGGKRRPCRTGDAALVHLGAGGRGDVVQGHPGGTPQGGRPK